MLLSPDRAKGQRHKKSGGEPVFPISALEFCDWIQDKMVVARVNTRVSWLNTFIDTF